MARQTAKKSNPLAKRNASKALKPATLAVHGGALRSSFGETSEAIFLTQGYTYPDSESAEARFANREPGFVYSRFANPTVAMFEERMRLIEGAGAARAAATGMAAVTASLLSHLKAGDHVVAATALFGSCRYVVEELLPKYGIGSTLVEGTDLSAWKKAVKKGKTKALFLESPTNPTLAVLDIEAIAEIAHKAGAKLIVDNVFATPIWQKPLSLGADIVVYSATKHIDGQGRCLGGVILSDEQFVADHLATFLRQTGPALSPFNAWVLLKGLETLAIRVERQTATAARLADIIGNHPKVARVFYPGRADHPQAELAKRQMGGGSSLVTFEVKGGKAAAYRLANALDVVLISNNLGDSKSLITHPSTTTHQRLSEEARLAQGITQGMLRFSIGLEDPDDLAEDVTRALDAA
ncbi:MAG: O-succinylhomoserine sulfhydrylase [Rhizobiales bacterium]|nr:O-succinylhomoserine sulfhydrylase [Hyphomicrobiales bacterium]MBN9010126.1 O-succinylhomoserine sulfhydrylase [Hyphomicrobiales bacterium]